MHQCLQKVKEDAESRRREDHERIEQLTAHLISCESTLEEFREKNRSLTKEKEKFLAYKATLPTKIEFAKMKNELEVEKSKKEQLKEKLVSTNKQLENSRAVEKANQILISERNRDIEKLSEQLEKSQENVRILENCFKAGDENQELPHVTISNLQREVSQLTADLTKFKKLAKTQRSALKNEATKHESEMSELKSQLSLLENQNEDLARELKELKLEFKLMRTSLEEVSQENVFLKQEKDELADENQQMKQLQLSEKYKTNKTVAKQLEVCHRQMREIFSIMQKFKSDKNVDLSYIIGANNEHNSGSDVNESASVPLGSRVCELHKDLAVFREELNDQAAAIVAENCSVQ